MKNYLRFFTLVCLLVAGTLTIHAQLAYMPTPLNSENYNFDPIISPESEDEIDYTKEDIQEYLPLAVVDLFGENDNKEDVSDFLPLASPLFGQEEIENNLPLESVNGYFIETGNSPVQTGYAIYSDNSFQEIIVAIDESNKEDVQVALYNTIGMNIKQENINTKTGFNNFRLDLEQLPHGLYTLKLTGNNYNVTKKFVIK